MTHICRHLCIYTQNFCFSYVITLYKTLQTPFFCMNIFFVVEKKKTEAASIFFLFYLVCNLLFCSCLVVCVTFFGSDV